MKLIALVVVVDATRKFDKKYSYVIPEHLVNSVQVGNRVCIPFGKGNRMVHGYVFSIGELSVTQDLKEVVEVISDSVCISEEVISICEWMKEKYICTYGDAIRCFVPMENSKGKGYNSKKNKYAYLVVDREQVSSDILENRIRTIQQIKVLEALLEMEEVSVSELVQFVGVSSSVLNTLKKNGYIDFKEVEVLRDPFVQKEIERVEPFVPTTEQSSVLKRIDEVYSEDRFHEFLLHGVTGSGKTEVFMQTIQNVFDDGKRVIVLVPEISLTPQMVNRFRARFGERVAVLHSRLSIGERFDQWQMITRGEIDVVVGVRSAVFAPFDNIGLIVIDEEHESTYKSETTPKYNAIEVARQRCKKAGAILISASATPSIESYYRATSTDFCELLEMKERTNKKAMPEIYVADMREELELGNRSIFSSILKREMEKNIEKEEQTILFLNKRGASSFVMCRECGIPIKCFNCNITLTYHSHDNRLICHYCGYTTNNVTVCPSCKSKKIKHFGIGTQKVEELIADEFPESVSTIRMDMDTTGYKNSHELILDRFQDENIDVLVGTQMVTKGHDFENVTLVGVLAADSMLNVGDYRASEKTFQLITQVIGRAGRGSKEGRAVIQTYNKDDFSIVAACNHDYHSFYEQEIRLREVMDYPPYTNIGMVIVSGLIDGKVEEMTREARDKMEKYAKKMNFDVDIMDIAKAPLSRIKNKYRWRIICKCENRDNLGMILANVLDKLYDKERDIRIAVDINPVNML